MLLGVCLISSQCSFNVLLMFFYSWIDIWVESGEWKTLDRGSNYS